MTYVIAQPCIGVMDRSCTNVCPVNCIYGDEEDEQMYINPDECINCGECMPVCPGKAIFPEEAIPNQFSRFVNKNKVYFNGPKDNGKIAVRQGRF